jgi:hypothetical protein
MSVTFSAAKRTFHAAFGADVLMDVPAAEDLSINMSNTNAHRISATLGIDLEAEGWAGSLSAEDFLGRVLLALAIEPADEGIPSHEVPTGGVRWVECGRPAGYAQERLTQLHALAQWAVDHGAEIAFG